MQEKKKFEKPVLEVVELETVTLWSASTCTCYDFGMCIGDD